MNLDFDEIAFYVGVPVGQKELKKAQLRNSRTIEIVGEDTLEKCPSGVVASLEFLHGHPFQLLVENSASRVHCRVRCRT